jgi:hypothetical protein
VLLSLQFPFWKVMSDTSAVQAWPLHVSSGAGASCRGPRHLASVSLTTSELATSRNTATSIMPSTRCVLPVPACSMRVCDVLIDKERPAQIRACAWAGGLIVGVKICIVV